MSGAARRPVAHHLVGMATAVMLPSRQDWGRAIAAEVACATSRAERARLVLAAVRMALLPPPGFSGGLRDYGRAAGRSTVLAAVAYVPLGVGLYLSNVVFPHGQDAAPGVLAMDGYLLLVPLAAGALARRASARTGALIIAGMATGVALALLGMATFAVLDNAFFSVISHQQEQIDNFRASGMTSMHAYFTSQLESTAPGLTIVGAVAGAFLAPIGAALSADVAGAWSRRAR
jgi:hypothetical protein